MALIRLISNKIYRKYLVSKLCYVELSLLMRINMKGISRSITQLSQQKSHYHQLVQPISVIRYFTHCLCGSMFGPSFVIQSLVSFLVCNHLDGEERADCFTLSVFLVIVTGSVLLLFITVP